jgi:formate hydrogenlyase transcriptional activator
VDTNIIAALVESGIRSYLTLPLIARGKVVGVLNLASLAPEQYSVRDAEFLQEIAQQIALAVENTQAYEEIARLKARLEQENIYLQEEIKTQHSFEEIIGRSPVIQKVLQAVETVAPTDAGVLILGETGTGKELIARAIHNLSPRKESVLVKVNCAALPAGLIESELFGHEKGAFTGALARKSGRFETANSGTIFLDEIGDLPLDLQAKLLRVLQEGEFERVGSSQTLKVEVRVIAATNRDLEKAVRENQFRSDLFYRLNVFPIRLPSLRERKEDIPLLVRHLVLKYNLKFGKKIEVIPPNIMEALQAYAWPGNVRELENIIERAVILSQGSRLPPGEWMPTPSATLRASHTPTLEELEREHIISVLETTVWRVSGERGAARLLGMKPTTLEARMKKLGIERKR